jgi:CRAL/TRIO domain
LKTFYPHTMGGFDKQGRPILWEISGAMNVTAVQTMTSKETLMAYHFWTMETKLASMFSAAAERTPADSSPPNATCAVLDFAGFGLAHLTPACVNQLKAFISVDNVCYPETLGKMLVINAPWVAVNAWGMVKGWLDPRTVAKIEIISAADSIRRLHELIDDCFIPPQYGGSGPELYFPKSHTELVSVPRSGEVVKYFEVPVGAGIVVDSYVVDGQLEVVLAVLSPSEATKAKAQKPPLHKVLASSSPGRTFLRKADLSPNSKEGIPDRLIAQFSSTELGNATEPVVVVAAWSNAARLVGRNLAYTATVVPAV